MWPDRTYQVIPVAPRHMRQLRPGLTCHFGKTFFCRKRNKIRVSLYVILECECESRMRIGTYLHTYIVYTFILNVGIRPMKGRSAQTTSQRFSGRSVLDISRTVRRYHRNHGPSTEARAGRRITAPVLSTQLPRPQAAYTAQPTIPFSGALWDSTEAGTDARGISWRTNVDAFAPVGDVPSSV